MKAPRVDSSTAPAPGEPPARGTTAPGSTASACRRDTEASAAAAPADPSAAIAPATGAVCSPEEAAACLLGAALELNAAPDLETGLGRVATMLRRWVPFESLGVLLLDDLGRELRFAFALGYPPDVAAHWRFGMGQGIIGTAAQSRAPVLVADVTRDPRYIDAGQRLGSELALPLLAKGRTVGVLDLGSTAVAAFDGEHLRLLSTLAPHLASAIEGARLYQNTREQARTLALLHEIGLELGSILDRQRLLERVGERIKTLVPYDRYSVLLWRDERQLLEPAVVLTADRAATQGRALALGHGLCGTAAALRQPLRVPNVHVDPRFVPCSGLADVQSELVVPLLFKDRLLGVIDLESVRYDAFTAQHEQLLSTLASALAVTFENARLVERLHEDERQSRADLETARQIQRQLLPRSTPWVPGLQVSVAFEPARQLGGDFYDFLPYGEGRVAIALADVAGKATAAALYGSFAVGILREHAAQHRLAPAELLAELNEKLRQLAIDGRFLAMAFAVYDTATRRLELANAGLPFPYLLRAGAAQRLEIGGVPLGLLPGRGYAAVELDLGPGDAVVLASDGIEENLDPRGVELGRAQVAAHLEALAGGSAADIAQGLLAACRAHSAGADPSDDRTIVALKVPG